MEGKVRGVHKMLHKLWSCEDAAAASETEE